MAENDALSLSLDDLIEKNKSKGSTAAGAGRGRSRGTGARSGRGGTRPSNNSNGNNSRAQGLQVSIRNSGVRKARGTGTKRLERPAPAEVPRRLEELDGPKGWSHSAFQQTEGAGGAVGGRLAGRLGTRAGTKLAVSNLDHNVSEQDLNELFSNVGALTSCTIDFDASGRSLGTAEVLFKKAEDAQTAIQQYNQVALDGKPMGLKLLDSARPQRYGSGAARGNAFAQAIGDISGQEGAAAPSRMRSQGGGSGMRSDRVGGGGGGVRVTNSRRGGGGGRRGGGLRSSAAGASGRSAEDLDADLDTYMQG